MNEDYVSFEVAKLLKEKGFDLPCQAFYDNDRVLIVSPVHTVNDELEDSDIACPTLYVAQKWLREVQGIHIVIDFKSKDSWYYRIYDLDENELIEQSEEYFNTYEGALQAGILESLK